MRIPQFSFVLLALLIPACDSLQIQHQVPGFLCPKQKVTVNQDLLFLGEVSALRNNKPWNVRFGALYPESSHVIPGGVVAYTDSDSRAMEIIMLVTASDGGPYGREETLTFPSIPKRLGTYPLNEFSVQATKLFAHIHGYDVGSGYVYNLEPSEGGFITVDSFDPGLCTIQGTFAMTLIRNPVDSEEFHCPPCDYLRVYVDTLRITDGKFHTRLVID